MAESVIPDTPKPEMREAEEPHGSTLRAEKAGDGERGMEGLRKPGIPTSGVQKENNEVSGMTESKKTNDSVLGTHGNGRGTSDMNEIKKPGDNMASDQGCFNGKHLISNSKKSDIKSTQKEDDSKCEGAGSEIPSDDKSSIHDGSGDKTDSENVLEANSQKIQVDRSSELNKVKKSAVPIDAHKNVDVVDKLIDDNLNDTFELIMPSSQDLMKAVKAYEAKQSPFKPEEVIPSEDEEPSSLTLKIPRHSHLKSKRAKVRKRPCTKSKASDATVVGSVKHLPDESSVDVSTISNAAAGTSRRRKLSYEDIDQSDKSDIILQASKQRRLSNKDPLENDSKNEVNDMTSRRRSRRCPGEIQQIETEDVVNTDKENGKARTSKIVKGQDEIVASADSQTETNVKLSIETSRREKSLRSGVHRNKKEEQGFKSEQSNKPRKGRRRLKEVVESTEDNDNKETGKRSVDKKEDVENALATSIRPSIQQKMTRKIRDSLGSDKSEGSPAPEEERSKSRSRGRLSSNSQNEVNERVELSTHRTLRSRKVSLSKPPSEELLKNSEDFGGNTSKDVKEKKITDSVPGRQNVSLRKSPGQSKGDGEVTSVTDSSKNRSPQKVARRNDIEIVSNRERKRKTEETVTEAASKRSKKAKSQENSADRCSPETSKNVLNTDESFKDLDSDFRTRISGRKERQTANVEAMQEPSTNIHSVLKSSSSSSIESVQSCTGRSVRRRMAVAVKDTNLSFLNVSGRPQRGVKHAKSADEERAEHLPAKQTKTEEKLSKTHSPSFENSVQNDEVKCVQSPRRGRTRRKVMSSQKSEITETAKHDTKSGQRERTSRISKTDKTYKGLENEPTTPKSRKINLSADQDITPQHARSSRGRGTPQSNIRLSSQKSDSNVSTQRRSTPRRMASAGGTAHHVLFTGFSDSKQEYVVRQLGGRVVDLPESCSVLVTDRVRRTYKFLCIMGRGKPIVSPEWLAQCQRSGCFVDPWKFLIKDHESESKFKFQLRESLEVAARTNLLAGYSVYVTPKVNPPPSEMKGIIESCGGVFMSLGAVKSWPVNSFIISCSDDKASWSKLKKSGKPIVGADVLLLGVLHQKLDLKSNTLV
ncbi:Mediator of DNA damage checkpoint protein 1 [Zootermopsis nevadensis]|uniref:PAX-interacting protein 1 n=1 Tax=Zootermopsis nevadensis TaxID=136037 RepID=A0A067RA28_ZOONE|nr:Mediator of DNA damage checkpoint protein 1 [Zootermopsis nevadensis]